MSNLEQIVAKSAARYVSFETNLDLMPGWRECSILLRHHARPCLVCTSLGAFNVPLFFRDARFREVCGPMESRTVDPRVA
jgi:hypothetical protein